MIKNNKGFSILELVIASTVFLTILGVVTYYFVDFIKISGKTDKTLSEDIQKDVATKYIWKDLQNATLTFNNITSDRPEYEFFQYQPGCPRSSVSATHYDREFKLDKINKTFSFVSFAQQDEIPFVYSPVDAYNVGAAPSAPDQEAALTFVGLNRANKIKGPKPDLWMNGNILSLVVPAWIRPDIDDPCGANKFPRQPVFFGVVSNDQFSKLDSGKKMEFKNPLSGADYTDVDNFLRVMPAFGGAAPILFIQKLIFIKYEYKESNPGFNNQSTLSRLTYDGVKLLSEYVVAVNVKEVIFKRKTIVEPLIEVEINLNGKN